MNVQKELPESVVDEGHDDWTLLGPMAVDLNRRATAGGGLGFILSSLLREALDYVIATPLTGRAAYDELDVTEQAYIHTRVEIMLRADLGLPRGSRLDVLVLGNETDIKHTMGNTWMIPAEAVDHPCILVAADEARAVCFLGLIVARRAYLTGSMNRDQKRSVAAEGFRHVLWLLREHPYPPNFWRDVPADAVARIFSGKTGNERMMALFRELQGTPISRDVVEAVARQKDFMRRIRADGGHGTRDRLAAEGILLLSATHDGPLMRALGLPQADFFSCRPRTDGARALARAAGWPIR
jgi:hypothetical protein